MIPMGLVKAIRTLTILSVPGEEGEDASSALRWFPVVGLLIGLLLAAVGMLLGDVWPEGVAALIVAAYIVLTRGLHLDGLADWADGFWGGGDKERVLAIMKDSCVGTFGSCALIAVLLAKWVAYTHLIRTGNLGWIVAACVVSRSAQVILAASHPYARDEDGTGAAFINGAAPHHIAPTLTICIVLALLACGPSWAYVGTFASAWIATGVFGAWCRKRVGGVTGDLLGAGSELVETLVLMMGALWI